MESRAFSLGMNRCVVVDPMLSCRKVTPHRSSMRDSRNPGPEVKGRAKLYCEWFEIRAKPILVK